MMKGSAQQRKKKGSKREHHAPLEKAWSTPVETQPEALPQEAFDLDEALTMFDARYQEAREHPKFQERPPLRLESSWDSWDRVLDLLEKVAAQPKEQPEAAKAPQRVKAAQR